MTNEQVVMNFWMHKAGKSLNMKSTGDKLFSYATCVAEWHDDTLYLNTTKYSVTTSKQTSRLRAFASDYYRYQHKVEYVECGVRGISSVYGVWLDMVKPKRGKALKAFNDFKESLDVLLIAVGKLVVFSPKTIDLLKNMQASVRPNNYKRQKMIFENIRNAFHKNTLSRARMRNRCVASEFAIY